MAGELLLGGEWVSGERKLAVHNKFNGRLLDEVSIADSSMLERAVSAARECADGRIPSPRERSQWLSRAASLLEERSEAMARGIAEEAGKPIQLARAEVRRAVETLTVSAEEAKRIAGYEVPVAAAPGAENRLAFTMRFPLGVVCAITPFNYPLNLSCHKIGPALASGNTVVWKPASTTPLTALSLAQILFDAGVPAGFLNVVVGSGVEVGDALLRDPRIDFYTFTGSLAVGEHIHRTIGVRRAALELGSTCGVIVHEDADLTQALDSCVSGAFDYAGQNCDGVQRIFVHQKVYAEFRERFASAATNLRLGDPLDPTVDVGPMISTSAAVEALGRVTSALEEGGTALTGARLDRSLLAPTVLENVALSHQVAAEEIFAPVAVLFQYTDINAAVGMLNASRYGLQAGVFTRDLETAWKVARKAQVGGVMVNESSCYRCDLMPFGGAKMSGIGREGPRHAISEMTEERLVLFNLSPEG